MIEKFTEVELRYLNGVTQYVDALGDVSVQSDYDEDLDSGTFTEIWHGATAWSYVPDPRKVMRYKNLGGSRVIMEMPPETSYNLRIIEGDIWWVEDRETGEDKTGYLAKLQEARLHWLKLGPEKYRIRGVKVDRSGA